jgi:4-hydroxymandelate oxidase
MRATQRRARAPVTVADFEAGARQSIDPSVYDFCAGGAGTERTVAANEAAFARAALLPRVLVDTARVETSLSLLGVRLATPVLLAPVAFNRLLHADGECAAARAAAAEGSLMVVSTMASTTLEDVAAAAGPLWFQLYVLRDRGLTRSLIERTETAGYRALVITVDVPRLGRRPRDLRHRFSVDASADAPNLRDTTPGNRTSSFVEFNRALLEPSLTWESIAWIRSITRLPIVLKGILAADDAERAIDSGVSGLIVSNHGGRQLDGAMATLDALPAVVDRIAGRCPVLLDGGVRGGVDVLVALAAGARAVLIGRPYLWGLAVDGERGVRQVLTIFREEFELAMALAGCTRVEDIRPALLGGVLATGPHDRRSASRTWQR